MPKFITLPSELPMPGSKAEKASLDFKARPTNDSFENAKDVAAFANASGGTILIGAAATGELLATYLPLAGEEASQAQRAVEQAVRDRCRPAPIFEVAQISKDTGIVLAINIWPFPGQPIGVEVKKGDRPRGDGEKLPEGLYFFPIRVGSHTKSITPDQLPMFMDARLRRITICLETALGKDIYLYSKYASRGESSIWFEVWRLEAVDLLANSMTVVRPGSDGEEIRVAVPLDGIDAAYRSSDICQVLLKGKISTVEWAGNRKSPVTGKWMIFDPNQ
jgi:Putative DNA-binding domain